MTSRLDAIKEKVKWPSLSSIVMVEAARTIKGVTTYETRYSRWMRSRSREHVDERVVRANYEAEGSEA